MSLTALDVRALLLFSDGQWHRSTRTTEPGKVANPTASRLFGLGLLERRGESRIIPSSSGFEYRINDNGRKAISERNHP